MPLQPTLPPPTVVETETPALTLQALVHHPSDALEALFASGTGAASDLVALAGHPHGRVLAVPAFGEGVAASLVRWVASTPLILWQGKSFGGLGTPGRGTGANRAIVGRRLAVFPFATSVEPSVVDGQPCVVVSYDVPRNPRVMRPIYDELRLVAPGIYLGRGTYRRYRRGARLILWFALDVNAQDSPLALPTPGA